MSVVLFPECLRLYNESVKLLNSPLVPYSVRCRIKKDVLFYEKQCVSEGVWDV